ncbi:MULTISPECIES: protein phosphatase 2C domain-containing protein [Spirulina sp. CCY15215]|uniref:PP2C family protein-serine/threonine phosphatase n=1 Tax=Spirulina sp. CCY15215 TaxID=2767591 RepID=UPI0019509932|nr:protein phosphatase 2C domain-containing protein [Spirulina major]
MKQSLVIEMDRTYAIDAFQVTIEAQIANFADIDYFRVQIQSPPQLGLLRVGSAAGGLARERELREILGEHQMLSPLLAIAGEDAIELSSDSPLSETEEVLSSQASEILDAQLEELEKEDLLAEELETDVGLLEEKSETDAGFLEEECYEPVAIASQTSGERLFLLSKFPQKEENLATWLEGEHSQEGSLLLASQVCQFFRVLSQKQWCLVSLFPQFIQMGTPIRFFDLTGVYPTGEILKSGLVADYCAPEVASDRPIDEQMSTYIVGLLLYQAIHHRLPEDKLNPDIDKIPRIHQILKIALNPIADDRFFLSQLLNLLVETRQSLRSRQIRWQIASQSTVGLSENRLHNEDSYGIRQQPASNSPSWIIAAVADGMGGMAEGEVASQLAIQTVLETPLPPELNKPQTCRDWVMSLVEKANEAVSDRVKDGGTTLSITFTVERNLYLAHVGDSRIFLLRKGTICQLSEDHSMVAMLLASGEISYQESLNHPDSNLLLKSLGSKPRLSAGYAQNLSRFGEDFSLVLEDGDILLLCSDGVWGLVSPEDLAQLFTDFSDLQEAIDEAIASVLKKGADDNATLIALKCLGESRQF